MAYRETRVQKIKRDLSDMWLIISRMPILVLFASSLIGGMAFIIWVIAHLVNFILGV